MFKESVKMSWSNIVSNKLRSFLTILGIVIGVTAIIALMTTVQGATDEITNQISALGADKIIVNVTGTPLKIGLNQKDLDNLKTVDKVKGVSPTVTGMSSIAGNNISKKNVTVQGKNEMFFKADPSTIRSGRPLNHLDVQNSTNVALIGKDIENELFYGKNPIGETIVVSGKTFTVVGTLKDSGGFSLSSNNKVVMIPYTTAMKTLGVSNISSVDLYMSDSNSADEIIDNVNVVLNQAFNYKENVFSVFNMQDMISAIGDITGMMTTLLVGIAAISLLVGGIGIMNMMLVSVTERTTEIGLRKALGAEPYRIQLQFIIESIFLSIMGGIIGFLFGGLISLGAALLIGISFKLAPSTIILAIGFSAAVGIVFGYAPARKASRLNPIDALRRT